MGQQIERLQVEMRHARAEIAALRNRIDANEVRIEEVVLLISEFRDYVEARLAQVEVRLNAMEAAIRCSLYASARNMASNLQVLLAAIEARK